DNFDKTHIVPRSSQSSEERTIYIDPHEIQEIPIHPNYGKDMERTVLIHRSGNHSDNRPDVPLPANSDRTVLINRPGVKLAPMERDVQTPNFNDAPTRLIRPSVSNSPQGAPPKDVNSDEIGLIVGWIVAITGPMKGSSFSLGVGQNQIGRDQGNRVCLSLDPGVSRKGHIVITYDPRRTRFSARPGADGSGITDLNDELLELPTPLKLGDTLKLSDDTTLRFIPFCDNDFSW
ncbi:MAG: FHA domain-containing protein, partial [Akkermansia sp.]